jgi:hypothetical protein
VYIENRMDKIFEDAGQKFPEDRTRPEWPKLPPISRTAIATITMVEQ